MGAYLQSPKTEKISEDQENSRVRVGVSCMQGWRTGMEDAHMAVLNLNEDTDVFGVFDGHGGKEVAIYVSHHMGEEIKRNSNFNENVELALSESFLKMDEMLQTKEGKKELLRIQKDLPPNSTISDYECEDLFSIAGCTSVTATIRGTQFYCANAGDSRCVLAKKKQAVEMSIDHKPDLEKEKSRIYRAGGVVEDGRVNGNLNLSRSIGDLEYKKNTQLSPQEQLITAYPEIKKATLSKDHDFFVLACDGVWDVMTNQEIVDYIYKRLEQDSNIRLSQICEEVFDKCLAQDVATSGGIGCDNMTCMIVQFKK